MEPLEYAQKGGRVGAIRVLAADLLKVKPILTFRDGLGTAAALRAEGAA